MRLIKRILSNIHRYLLCALLSVVFWAWIFTLVTDTVPAKKVTVLIDVPSVSDTALASKLREALPDGLRTVKVYPLSYMDMSLGMSDEGDIYILPESRMERAADYLCSLGEWGGADGFTLDGEVYGRLIRASGEAGSASEYIGYGSDENYYICITKTSPHAGELNGSKNDAALEVAEKILALP